MKKGQIYINKDGINKVINPEDLEMYVALGWMKGNSNASHPHIPTEEEMIRRKEKLRLNFEKKFTSLLNAVSREDLYKYYEVENHSQTECLEYFNISLAQFYKLIKYYEIEKSKEAHNELIKKSKLEKYGSTSYNNREKARKTCLEKYGVDNPFKDTEKIKQSYIDKLGVDHPMHRYQIAKKCVENHDYIALIEKTKSTVLKRYGVDNASKLDWVQAKIKTSVENTFLEKYGCSCYWTTENPKVSYHSEDSLPNKSFANILDNNNIAYSREFSCTNFRYDFKINKNLVEINPTVTHNTSWSLFADTGLSKDYHFNKSKTAAENGYRCIHVFDWDDKDKIVAILKERPRIYARKCAIGEVDKFTAMNYLNTYHLQGYARDEIRLGLYYNDELVEIMTFGKPRYNKNYQYELIRLCGHYQVVGGAEKLFNYFVKKYDPESIISYCDNSKFKGDVYTRLGFRYKSISIGKHWFNMKTGQHITDNLLRQRGYDQLFGTNYGKGTSNEELMLENGFVEIYDAGQAVYIWNKNIK